MFERVVRNGHARVDSLEQGKEQDSLRDKINEAETRWATLKEKCDENCKDVDKLYPYSQKYSDEAVTFSIWLEKAEKKKDDLESQPLLPNENDLKKQRKDTEVSSARFQRRNRCDICTNYVCIVLVKGKCRKIHV